MRDQLLRAMPALAGCALLSGTASAQFTQDNTNIPGEGSNSENLDFGDVDLDGDWDVAVADGGDDGNDQNRMWINAGGLQGGTVGDYQDVTAARLPNFSDDSRDIEFVDFDDDADLDIYISNTAQISNQGNRWWTNVGGAQGGTLGFYTDETAARWVGLNSANSSIDDNLLLPDEINPETFIDWSCDCDFGDLDNDGDLDLFHSSYGGIFGGDVPSRIFLNDGDGFFEEFNPSGYKVAGDDLLNGEPGLWAEGIQQNNTNNSDGTNCDVTSTALDIDLGDIDGDLDLDVLHGSRQTDPRLFVNRLEENGGVLGFRDVSAAQFPANWASGGNNYEQEMGDIDNDNDLDIYGLNWNGFTDVYMFNDGAGNFSGKTNLPSSGADDNEGDFLDYDNDGDLDLFVANFSGTNKLYRNQFVETGNVNYVLQQSGLGGGTSLDADCADYDADGDTDFIIAQDNFAANEAFLNTTNIIDEIDPVLAHLEQVADGASEKDDEVVRVQAYGNEAYYITWYNDTFLDVTVQGVDIPSLRMKTSGGNIFRGELPGNFTGLVEYSARQIDENGNVGVSGTKSYTNSGNSGFQVAASTSTPSSVGTPLVDSLTRGIAGEQHYVYTDGVAPGSLGILLVSTGQLQNQNLGDGAIVNIDLGLLATFEVLTAGGNGQTVLAIGQTAPALSGTTLYMQYIAADGAIDTWASSKTHGIIFQ